MQAEFEHEPIDVVKERVKNIPVCIIIPPSPFLADERVFPFLGPLIVAEELRRNGNPVEVLDLSGFSNYEEIVAEYVKSTNIRTFGLTATTPQLPSTVKIAQLIKEHHKDSRIILGGPHATLTHTAAVEDKKVGRSGRGTAAFKQLVTIFHKIVDGDGENSIFEAIDPSNSNIIIDAGTNLSPLFIKRGQLDQHARPARDLIDLESYQYHIDGFRATSIVGQLGCPFKCGFCGGRESHVFRAIRNRSTQSIVDEIEEVVKKSGGWKEPLKAMMIYDDELNVNPKVLEELCLGLIGLQNRLGFEMRFRGFIKAELFTAKQAELMYQAGFRILLSGVESGSDLILNAMQKNTSRETNARCVDYAHQAGLKFKALMSIGHPGESSETIANSVDWALKYLNQGDDIDWTVITQYPGSPYYDKSVWDEENKAWLYQTQVDGQTLQLWSQDVNFAKKADYYKGIPGEYEVYVWTKHLSPAQLVTQRDTAEKITRAYLDLPPIVAVATSRYEHSMGQTLPANIYRVS